MLRPWLLVIGFWLASGASGQNNAAGTTESPASPLDLVPSRLDFGSQPAGTRSQSKTATLTNRRTQQVNIRDLSVSGIDFSEAHTCQDTLAPGAQCTIEVNFAPATTGPRLGTVLISTDSAGPLFLVLTGTGE